MEKNIKSRTQNRKNVRKKVDITSKKKVIKKEKNKKDIITIIDYTFLISLVLSIIFGMQTNPAFLMPFIIVLVITLVCMGIILVNAIYMRITRKIKK